MCMQNTFGATAHLGPRQHVHLTTKTTTTAAAAAAATTTRLGPREHVHLGRVGLRHLEPAERG